MDTKKIAKAWGIHPNHITVDGDNLTVGGYLDLRGTGITSLPDNLTVGGYLDLSGTGITSLPDNLTVGGYLDLSGTGITSLPDNLTVGGSLYLSGTGIKHPKKLKRPDSGFSFRLRASIEVRFNLRGFARADGILARIVSARGAVRRVIVAGQKEISYLVSDDAGNHAHGKTLKEARESLIYKAVASFDGKLPAEATGKEWVGIYRAVTGACAFGVESFVKETGVSLSATYTPTAIAEMVEGRFGADSFAAKLSEGVAA